MNYIPRLRLFAIGLISAVLFAINSSATESQTFESVVLRVAGENFTVEIAKTYSQRQQGLMFRDNLPANKGMLFLFPFEGDNRIWMKNTLISLTVVWLDHNARVLTVKHLEPCSSGPCPSFGADSPSSYVLELPATFSKLKAGDQIPDILNLDAR